MLSCSSNDDDPKPAEITEANLLGKWFIRGGNINGGSYVDYEHKCTENRDYQEFLSNHMLRFIGYDKTCTISDNETSLWVLEGEELTVSNLPGSSSPFKYTFTVLKLTSAELKLHGVYLEAGQQLEEIIYLDRE